jgi:adenylate cyclase
VPAAVLALWTIVLLVEPAPIVALKQIAFDGYQTWQPRARATTRVRVVDIDEASLQRFGQWPWPRTVLADIVTTLTDAGAAVIAIDMVLAEADRTSPVLLRTADGAAGDDSEILLDHDRVFAEAIAGGPVVTGFIMSENATGALPPRTAAGMVARGEDPFARVARFDGAIKTLALIEQAARGNGALNFVPGSDGVVRRVPLLLRLGDVAYPSLSAEAIRVALSQPGYGVRSAEAAAARQWGEPEITRLDIGGLEIETDDQFSLWINYAPLRKGRYVPAWRVLADDAAVAAQFKNAIVFIGTSAAGLKDLRITALRQVVPGVEIHAQVVEQVLDGTYRTRHAWSRGAEILALTAVAIVLVTLMAKMGALWSAVIAIAMVIGAVVFSAYAYAVERLLFDPLGPAVGLIGIFIATSVVRHIRTEQERSWIHGAFESYVSPNLVQHLIDHPEALKLGGEVRECSFVLTDLQGFTRLVETQPPDKVVALLNEYFSGMTEIVFRHDGTVEKIVGDALAVMFSAPVAQADHAQRAVACALEIDGFCETFAARKRKEGVPLGMTRIGVHSGPVIVGNIGGSGQIDYRALGDPINTTARLEAANKRLGTRMIVSEATVRACPEFIGRPVGQLVLRGKQETIKVFEPLTAQAARSTLMRDYGVAYELIEKRDHRAITMVSMLFEKAPKDPLIARYMARLKAEEMGAVIDLAGG